jgi:hypothetical protein
MSWERLAARLNKLPLVLAGPILRQVTTSSVTVWVVTRAGASATLKVQDDKGIEVARGTEHSVAVGSGLHIVAIKSVILDSTRPLVEGVVYQYDIEFLFDGNASTVKLAGVSDISKLVYAPWTLPSFSLPPKDLTQLHLLQGSCRKPSAEGVDMMPYMDDLIAPAAGNPYTRPHQLLLTGDQIYADDVAEGLRLMLTDAADTLFGWDEILPLAEALGGRRKAADIHASRRWSALYLSGFTSEDLRGHLLSLGEYICMYLFVWSPVLWPASLPTTQDVIDEVKVDRPTLLDTDFLGSAYFPIQYAISKVKHWADKKDIKAANDSLVQFRDRLEKVRRVLANVPTYMVFDDHDITDDWNMTRQFCQGVYGNDFGLRVLQNALVAYSLCQHWGNVPDEFMFAGVGGRVRPGYSLRGLVDTPSPLAPNAFANKAASYENSSEQLRTLLGIHTASAIRARHDAAVFHEPQALRYDFSVEGAGHQIIFTDTRSWRSFPDGADGTHLLTKNDQTDQYQQQIVGAESTRDRLLFVVLTTNAPTVEPIRAATRHDNVTKAFAYQPDLYEAWDLPSVSFNRLLVALTSKLPVDTSGQHTGAVVLVSGDVHHSFASRLVYRASRRYEDGAQDTRAAAVIAQLVGSSLKKQTEDTVGFQRKGYFYAPKQWATDILIRHVRTEGYIGWSFPPGVNQMVGTWHGDFPVPIPFMAGLLTVDVTRAEPIHGTPPPSSIVVTTKPHYRIRLDYLLPFLQSENIPKPPPITPPPPGSSAAERLAAAKDYDVLLKYYQSVNGINPPKVVGVNNLSEIRLEGANAATRKVRHTLHWTDANTGVVKNTSYLVRLDVNTAGDSEFPDIRAPVEPS